MDKYNEVAIKTSEEIARLIIISNKRGTLNTFNIIHDQIKEMISTVKILMLLEEIEKLNKRYEHFQKIKSELNII